MMTDKEKPNWEDPRRVYGIGETPSELAEMLITEIECRIAEYEALEAAKKLKRRRNKVAGQA